MKKTIKDDDLSLFKNSDDATKLQAFGVKHETQRLESRHSTIKVVLCTIGSAAIAAVARLLYQWS